MVDRGKGNCQVQRDHYTTVVWTFQFEARWKWYVAVCIAVTVLCPCRHPCWCGLGIRCIWKYCWRSFRIRLATGVSSKIGRNDFAWSADLLGPCSAIYLFINYFTRFPYVWDFRSGQRQVQSSPFFSYVFQHYGWQFIRSSGFVFLIAFRLALPSRC